MPKIRWRPGLCPGPREGEEEEDTPSPIPTLLGAFGASIHAPSALSFCGPQCKILAAPLC